MTQTTKTTTTTTTTPLMPGGYSRVDQVADLLAIHRTTLYRWSKRGKFPQPVKVNGVTLYKNDDLRTFLHRKEDR